MKALKVEGKRIGKVWVFKTRKLLEGSPLSVKEDLMILVMYAIYLFVDQFGKKHKIFLLK